MDLTQRIGVCVYEVLYPEFPYETNFVVKLIDFGQCELRVGTGHQQPWLVCIILTLAPTLSPTLDLPSPSIKQAALSMRTCVTGRRMPTNGAASRRNPTPTQHTQNRHRALTLHPTLPRIGGILPWVRYAVLPLHPGGHPGGLAANLSPTLSQTLLAGLLGAVLRARRGARLCR